MNDLFDKSRRAGARASEARRAEDRRVIAIRGAREHNLKGIDVEIPRDRLVVFTGLSGSGKSSLAFDTIYAEGQRRYVESLSAYARQFLEMMQKPDVDQIDGLSPAISIEQKTTSRNPRSTVGTVTEIYDYMRLLWARVGVPYSPATGLPIESQTVSQMVDRVLALPEGTRCYLLAPVVRGRKGEYRKELAEYLKKGYQRVKIDGKFHEIAAGPRARQEVHPRHRRGGGPHRGARRCGGAARRQLRAGAEARRWAWRSSSWPTVPAAPTSPLRGGGRREAVGRGVEARADDTSRLAPTLPQGGRASSEAEERKKTPKSTTRAARAPHLLREIRLPGLRLHHSRGRAADCSRSTTRSAPARSAAGSASSSTSTPTW